MEIKKLKPGTCIRLSRLGIWYHYGIYIGNGMVCDMCDPNMSPSAAVIHYRPLKEFCPSGKFEVVDIPTKYSRQEICKRAIAMAKSKQNIPGKYDVMYNNCETFVYKVFQDHDQSPYTYSMFENLLQHRFSIPKIFGL